MIQKKSYKKYIQNILNFKQLFADINNCVLIEKLKQILIEYISH